MINLQANTIQPQFGIRTRELSLQRWQPDPLVKKLMGQESESLSRPLYIYKPDVEGVTELIGKTRDPKVLLDILALVTKQQQTISGKLKHGIESHYGDRSLTPNILESDELVLGLTHQAVELGKLHRTARLAFEKLVGYGPLRTPDKNKAKRAFAVINSHGFPDLKDILRDYAAYAENRLKEIVLNVR